MPHGASEMLRTFAIHNIDCAVARQPNREDWLSLKKVTEWTISGFAPGFPARSVSNE